VQGLKIAVVVNDVAKVNIDSKLVRERTGMPGSDDMADCVELQNGCACCNASDELLQVALPGLLGLARLGRLASKHRPARSVFGSLLCWPGANVPQGISQLLRLANRRGQLYDRMIIEVRAQLELRSSPQLPERARTGAC